MRILAPSRLSILDRLIDWIQRIARYFVSIEHYQILLNLNTQADLMENKDVSLMNQGL